MKHFFLSIILLFVVADIHAQTEVFSSVATAVTPSSTGLSKKTNIGMKDVIYVTPASQWSLIEMKTSSDMVYFSYLDGMSNLKVIVTNSNGNSIAEMKVHAKANAISCKKFKKGLYFFTLVNEATDDKKAFVYNKD